MKKILSLIAFLVITVTTSFAQQSNFPFTMSEVFVSEETGCSMSMVGSGVITVDNEGGMLTATASGSVTFTYGEGCGPLSGVSFSVIFSYEQPQGGQPNLTGTNQQSQVWLNAHPYERSKLISEIRTKLPF